MIELREQLARQVGVAPTTSPFSGERSTSLSYWRKETAALPPSRASVIEVAHDGERRKMVVTEGLAPTAYRLSTDCSNVELRDRITLPEP